jgi:hypothetical protein
VRPELYPETHRQSHAHRSTGGHRNEGASRFTLFQVDCSPAGHGPAATGNLWDIFRKTIVERELFATPYRTTAQIENMPPPDQGNDVGVAAMVKVLGSAAADRAIERPVVIEREQIYHTVSDYQWISLGELCPTDIFNEGHAFVVLTSYFDGGNHADSTVHDVLTLAAVTGTKEQWQPLERAWSRLMKESGVNTAFHTTDLVSLSGPFSRRKGWNESRRDKLLERCVSIIEPRIANKITPTCPGRIGLFPFTVTVPLADHKQARSENPDIPVNANAVCAIQALGECLRWGRR